VKTDVTAVADTDPSQTNAIAAKRLLRKVAITGAVVVAATVAVIAIANRIDREPTE
jgi:hypothetical protein